MLRWPEGAMDLCAMVWGRVFHRCVGAGGDFGLQEKKDAIGGGQLEEKADGV